MATQFYIADGRTDWADLSAWLEVNEVDRRDLLTVLGLAVEPYGQISATELRTRCVNALRSPEVDRDRQTPARDPQSDGRHHWAGRRIGFLDEKLRGLIALCDRADLEALLRGSVGFIVWS